MKTAGGDFEGVRFESPVGSPIDHWSNPTTPSPLCLSQVNMLIGIVVFNKLMSRDGISDKSKKQRAG